MEKRNQVCTFIGLRPAVPPVPPVRLLPSFFPRWSDAEKEQATENHNH